MREERILLEVKSKKALQNCKEEDKDQSFKLVLMNYQLGYPQMFETHK